MGHVDCTATLTNMQPEGISWVLTFQLSKPEHMPLLIPKGSICVNGISLTVNTLQASTAEFSIAIVPHTWTHTNVSTFSVGRAVNIEVDMLGKYIHSFWQAAHGESAEVNRTLHASDLAIQY
jgi:riboflavin synthase